jgi:hypothetical protein
MLHNLTDFSGNKSLDLQSAPIASEKPLPLYRELPAAQTYPIEALGQSLGDAAQAIQSMIQCPIECAANSVLAVASMAAQGRANVILPIGMGMPAPLSLYALTVLESGERKSHADKMALKPVRDFEFELKKSESLERQNYVAKLNAYETHAKELNNKHKKDRHALEAALRDLGPPPPPPLLSVLAPSGDQTMEGLFRIYQQGRPSLAMLCDDAASFIGGHSLKAEQKQGTTANLCRAWDGSKLERIRGGDGVIVLYDRRLAAHFMVQPGVAAGFLSDRQFADQGLLARFLVSAPKGMAGTRIRDDDDYQSAAIITAQKMHAYNSSIGELLRQSVRWKDEYDRDLGVEMDELHLSQTARALYVIFCNKIESGMASNGPLAAIKPFASKLAEQAARIAGVLTLVANPTNTEIDAQTLGDAINLAQYYLSEAERLTAVGMIDPEFRAAQGLLDWLLARPSKQIGLTDIYQKSPRALGLRTAKAAKAAMQILVDHGWVAPLKEGAIIDSKFCSAVWEVKSC